jgi:hypothetical protein
VKTAMEIEDLDLDGWTILDAASGAVDVGNESKGSSIDQDRESDKESSDNVETENPGDSTSQAQVSLKQYGNKTSWIF